MNLERRIQELEEQFATGERKRVSVRPEMRAVLDRIAAAKRGDPGISDEERAKLAEFERALKEEVKKRRAEGRI